MTLAMPLSPFSPLLYLAWGDIAQVTDSCAGCGESWPCCDGSLLPGADDVATAIELTHRTLTVLVTGVVIVLVVAARRILARGHCIRATTAWVAAALAFEIVVARLFSCRSLLGETVV